MAKRTPPLRSQQVHLKVSREEQQRINAAAQHLGLPAATWARMVLVAEARTVLTPDPLNVPKCG